MNNRLVNLDSLRGIAALTVFFSHAIGFMPLKPEWFYLISDYQLHIFYDGAAAVDLFFVLSGFCIAYGFYVNDKYNQIKYVNFVIRRIFRLYPAYLVALLICYLGYSMYVAPPEEYMSVWGREFWQWEDLTGVQVIKLCSLVVAGDTKLLNPPSWSLVVEMRIAFVLPFVIYFIGKYRQHWKWIILASLLINIIKMNIAGIGIFLPLFTVGILMAAHIDKIQCWINRLSITEYIFLMLIGWFLYECRFPFDMEHIDTTGMTAHLITGIGSSIFIMGVFRLNVQEKLSGAVGSFLGRISYSIYLIHFPIQLLCFSLQINVIVEIILALLISIILADLIYRYIELPCINVGKKIIE